jgi:hypothetical protein
MRQFNQYSVALYCQGRHIPIHARQLTQCKTDNYRERRTNSSWCFTHWTFRDKTFPSRNNADMSLVEEKVFFFYWIEHIKPTFQLHRLPVVLRWATGLMIGGWRPGRGLGFFFHRRVQTGSGAHPASYPMGTRGSFPGG